MRGAARSEAARWPQNRRTRYWSPERTGIAEGIQIMRGWLVLCIDPQLVLGEHNV